MRSTIPLKLNTFSHSHFSLTSHTAVICQFILQIKQHGLMRWQCLFCVLYIKSMHSVQLERTTSGCMEHRKQMPFLSAATTTDIEQLSPHGVLLIQERCFTFSCNQLFCILHQNNLNKEKIFSWPYSKNCPSESFSYYNEKCVMSDV